MQYPAVIAPLVLWVMFIITAPNSLKLSGIGLLDAISISALISALIVLPLILVRSFIGYIFSAFLIILTLGFNAGATIYSLTYNSYPTLDFSSVVGNSVHIFSTWQFVLAGLILLIILFAVAKLLSSSFSKISTTKLIITFSIFSLVFLMSQDSYKDYYKARPISMLSDTNAAGFLLRSAIPLPIWVQDIETMKYHERLASLNHFKEFTHKT